MQLSISKERSNSLLPGNTERSACPARRLGPLALDLKAPVVSQSSVVLDLLQPFHIFSQLCVQLIGDELRSLAILGVTFSVKEPLWDVVFSGPSEDVVNLLKLCFGKLASSLVQINLGNLKDNIGKSATDTLNHSQCKHDLVLALHIGIEDSQDVGELVRVLQYYGTLGRT